MREQKNTKRSTVHIGFDGRVYKVFRGPKAETRFATEVKVLRYLERRGCGFVPRVLEADPEELRLVTSNCGAIVESLSEEKTRSLFAELEEYGVRHDDPFMRNVTYRSQDGRFCIIDFEFATILDEEAAGDGVDGIDEAPVGGGDRTLSWSCRTDVGRFRKDNEDAFLALSLHGEGAQFLGSEGEASLASSDMVFAVSDGMGGARSGEFASRIAIDRITSMLPPYFRRQPGVESGDLDVLTDLFRLTHVEMTLMGESYPECKGMGATLSLCWFTQTRVLCAHIGDSRIYRWRPDDSGEGGLEQITKDDTRVGTLLRAGQISEYEARVHPARNMLSKALGGGNQYVDPQLEVVELQAGDRILICSDGVTDGVWDRAIGDLLEEGSDADELVTKACAASGRDNATAIVLEVSGAS